MLLVLLIRWDFLLAIFYFSLGLYREFRYSSSSSSPRKDSMYRSQAGRGELFTLRNLLVSLEDLFMVLFSTDDQLPPLLSAPKLSSLEIFLLLIPIFLSMICFSFSFFTSKSSFKLSLFLFLSSNSSSISFSIFPECEVILKLYFEGSSLLLFYLAIFSEHLLIFSLTQESFSQISFMASSNNWQFIRWEMECDWKMEMICCLGREMLSYLMMILNFPTCSMWRPDWMSSNVELLL